MDRPAMMMGLGVVLALGAGCVMALQPAVNSRLSSVCSHPLQASLISFGTGFGALIILGMFMRIGLPSVERLQTLPTWAWTGGLLGTYMVTVSLLFAPQLGATRWIALVLTGQIAFALILDHYGLIGYARQPMNLIRLLGISLVIIGVVVVMRN